MTQARTGPQPVGSSDFEVCYETHWWPMVRLATGLLGDRAAAEDAVQEAFTSVYRRWSTLVEVTRVGYLRVCVVNATRTMQRRQTTQRKHLRPVEDRPAAGADEGLVQQFDREDLRQALSLLPLRQREVLVLRFISELPDGDIALATGLSLGGVRSASSRGIAALRVSMGELR
jgi:RNA polymerase sigma-70 factor (sigma-E family)